MTPRQFDLAVQGALRARIAAQNAQIRAAYLTATLPTMKRPPKLADLLVSEKAPAPRRRKSSAELVSIAMQWHHALNRPVSGGARQPAAPSRIPKGRPHAR